MSWVTAVVPRSLGGRDLGMAPPVGGSRSSLWELLLAWARMAAAREIACPPRRWRSMRPITQAPRVAVSASPPYRHTSHPPIVSPRRQRPQPHTNPPGASQCHLPEVNSIPRPVCLPRRTALGGEPLPYRLDAVRCAAAFT